MKGPQNIPSTEFRVLPVIVHEEQIHPFKLGLGNTMREGIRWEDGLYGLMYEFDMDGRLDVYRLAWALAHQGVSIVVSESETRYVIWANLRSLTQLHRNKGQGGEPPKHEFDSKLSASGHSHP